MRAQREDINYLFPLFTAQRCFLADVSGESVMKNYGKGIDNIYCIQDLKPRALLGLSEVSAPLFCECACVCARLHAAAHQMSVLFFARTRIRQALAPLSAPQECVFVSLSTCCTALGMTPFLLPLCPASARLRVPAHLLPGCARAFPSA